MLSQDSKKQYSFYSARNARIASAVLAIAIPSVRPSVRPSVCLSVRHTPVLCQLECARANAQRDGHPAECMWRPLLNVVDEIAKITKPRRKTR